MLAYSGVMFKIAFARDRDGSNPAEEFFDQLPKADQAKLMNLFRILGDHGKHSNPEKFGDLGGRALRIQVVPGPHAFRICKGRERAGAYLARIYQEITQNAESRD